MLKRMLSITMALLLVLAMPVQVFAETYYLEDGSVVVSTDDTDQYVAQGGGEAQKQTSETIITQRDSSATTNSTITVDTSASGAKAAEITIQQVNISSSGTAIEVDSSSAVIHVEGNNTVNATESNASGTYCGEAAIQVSSGNLTITGGADDTLNASVEQKNTNSSSQAAAIGSDAYEHLDGSITIKGDLTVNAETGGSGAAIGTGFDGDLNGTITIQGGTVNAESNIGAAIGTGNSGFLNAGGSIEISGGTVNATADKHTAIGAYYMNGGSITISDGTVNATGGDNGGAGIGAQYTLGNNSDGGSINITGGTVTAAGGKWGAGIGNASSSALTADITISGGTVTAIGGLDSAGIGGGKGTAVQSDITIGGDATVIAQAGEATQSVAPNAIGNAGHNSELSWANGSVTITDNAQVYLADNGTTKPENQNYPDSGTTINGNAAVTQSSEDALTIRDRILAEQNKPAPQPVESSSQSNVKAVTVSASFWDTLIWNLSKAEPGSTHTVDLGSYAYIASPVIKAAQARSITLVIQWDGGEDITIAPTDTVDTSLWQLWLADLA